MLDTLELAARVQGVEHCVAYAPIGAHSYFQSLVPKGFGLIPLSYRNETDAAGIV
jgi:hypothetical protein